MAAIPVRLIYRRVRYSGSYFNYECGSVDDEHFGDEYYDYPAFLSF